MWFRRDIASAIESLEAQAVELSQAEAREKLAVMERAFATPGAGPLWERLQESSALRDAEGWRKIAEFVSGSALLLVQDAQGVCAFRFTCAADLIRVLDHCPGFEFYVCDDEVKYVLAFNHHDMLVGAGSALTWVQACGDR